MMMMMTICDRNATAVCRPRVCTFALFCCLSSVPNWNCLAVCSMHKAGVINGSVLYCSCFVTLKFYGAELLWSLRLGLCWNISWARLFLSFLKCSLWVSVPGWCWGFAWEHGCWILASWTSNINPHITLHTYHFTLFYLRSKRRLYCLCCCWTVYCFTGP